MNKILFLLPNLTGGGAERVIVNIINSLDLTKFDVYLVLAQNSGVYFKNINENVHLKVFNYKKVIFSFYGIRKAIKEIQPDLVFSTTHRMNFMAALASKFLKKNFILLLRLPNSPKLELENNQLSFIQKYIYSRAYQSANYVIAQTPEMAEEIHTYFKVKKENIKVLMNPIDQKLIDASLKDITNPFDSKKINIVAAGRIAEQKGYDVLIRSFGKVIEKNNDFYLNIIGDGAINKKKDLEELVVKLHLNEYIKFWGFQENPYRFFYFSNLYVLSSRWEGLPNTVLENLYLHKPIIATKCIPFMHKLIDHGNNGFLVNVDDAEQLAEYILKYRELGMNKININKIDIDNFFIQIVKHNFIL